MFAFFKVLGVIVHGLSSDRKFFGESFSSLQVRRISSISSAPACPLYMVGYAISTWDGSLELRIFEWVGFLFV